MHIPEEIIEGCKEGRRECQEWLYKKTYSYMMGICFRYTLSKETSQEIVNDSFFKILKNIANYNPQMPFKTWMTKIVINTIIDTYRKNKKKHEIFNDISTSEDSECYLEPVVFNEALHKLQAIDLYRLLDKLNEMEKTVFNLFAIDGYSHKEIANELDCSEEVSRYYLKSARDKLKKWILHDLHDKIEVVN
ncbi:MAG: sigma-70 family RNA polymerase sigma factor [Bacteroidia bacterium]|nr:sigma-70 family RNA polymerase sigma factor [Bacteroidia bacterium]